jgi:hypothetical protein
MTQENPWSGAGDSTRQEVREIFARHARASDQAETDAEVRRRPLPNLFRLPGQLWHLLPPLGRLAVGLTLAALAALAAVLVPPALDNAGENRANQRRAAAANLEEIRRTLIADQRPRRATLSLAAGAPPAEIARHVAERVTADARSRVSAGTLEGTIRADELSPGSAVAGSRLARIHLPRRAVPRARRVPRPRRCQRLPLSRARDSGDRRGRVVQGKSASAASRSRGVRGRGALSCLHGMTLS